MENLQKYHEVSIFKQEAMDAAEDSEYGTAIGKLRRAMRVDAGIAKAAQIDELLTKYEHTNRWLHQLIPQDT